MLTNIRLDGSRRSLRTARRMLVKRPSSAVRAAQRGNGTRNEVSAAFRRGREADPPERFGKLADSRCARSARMLTVKLNRWFAVLFSS